MVNGHDLRAPHGAEGPQQRERGQNDHDHTSYTVYLL